MTSKNTYLKVLTLIFAFIGILLLFFVSPPNQSHRLVFEFWNLGHAVLFFILTFTTLKLRQHSQKEFQILPTVLVCLLFAVLSELIQLLIANRSFTYADIINDLIGSSIAISLFMYLNKRLHVITFITVVAIAVISLMTFMSKLAYFTMDEWQMRRSFPTLANFESNREFSRWSSYNIERSDDQVLEGQYSLKATLSDRKYSGVTFKHFISNWQDFTSVNFSIWVSTETKLTLRVHDLAHTKNNQYNDRFNQVLHLNSGWNNINIPISTLEAAPKDRKMDMKNIAQLGIFSTKPHSVKSFYIDNIYLK